MIDSISDVDYEVIEAPAVVTLRAKVRNYLRDHQRGGIALRIEGGVFYDDDTECYCQVIAISKIEYEPN